MIYTIKPTSQFKTDFKVFKHNQKVIDEFTTVIDLLKNGEMLPPQYSDHQLTGKLKHCRECHIFPDVLLIYEKKESILTLLLIRI